MADKFRNIFRKLKDKVHLLNVAQTGKDRAEIIVKKYLPPVKVNELADKLKYDSMKDRLRDIIAKYEKFTGVEEIMAIQNTVIEAQDRFMAAQERRRDLGRQLANLEARLKELHFEMQNTMKGDDKYLQLCTEEHKLIIQERALRAIFFDAEREERELFATMSAAVKLGHERERAHAERNKYWYIVASIFGTVLGIAGSTINNHLKMTEFRDMMEQQMARSASVLYTMAGGMRSGDTASTQEIAETMKTEFAYHENLAQSISTMQENINQLVLKQTSLLEYLHQREMNIDKNLRELKHSIVSASNNSAESEAELTKALSVVHQDLEDVEVAKQESLKKVLLEPNQIATGVGILLCMAIILGNIIGKIS